MAINLLHMFAMDFMNETLKAEVVVDVEMKIQCILNGFVLKG